MSKVVKPQGLKLFTRDTDNSNAKFEHSTNSNYNDCMWVHSAGAYLDADQLDKLAERCKQWSKYLRSQKGKKPVPPKKWEDL